MSPELIQITALVAVVVLVSSVLWRRRQNPFRKNPSSPYAEILDHLLSGNKKHALRRLTQMVGDDPDNLDAYLKLGDLFRERGQTNKAIRIHRGLTVRPSLSVSERREILRSLSLDYLAAGKSSRAITTLKQLISSNKEDLWAHQTLLSVYEEEGEWEEALATLKQVQKLRKREDKPLLALYKVQAGLELARKGDHRGAEDKYREAIRMDKGCVAAYFHLGDSLRAEGKLKEAISAWKKLVDQAPESAHIVFIRLEEAFDEVGDYQAMATIYRMLLGKNLTDAWALSALAGFSEKKGNTDEAIRACEQALEVDPGSKVARGCLVRLYHLQGEDEKAVEQALALVGNRAEGNYRCRNCGYQSEGLLWRCPQCKLWRTFV